MASTFKSTIFILLLASLATATCCSDILHQHKIVKRQQQYGQPAEQAGGGFLSGLNSLAQQAQQMAQAQQFLQQAASLFQGKQQQQPPFSAQSPAEATARSALETAQSTSAQAVGGAAQTAQVAQTGMRSALAELSSGLQRIAQNNPNLLPDVKNLYQRVSSQLGGTSNLARQNIAGGGAYPSNIVPANNQDQLVDNLAKAAVPGLQIGQPAAPPQPGFLTNLLPNLQ